MNTTSIKIESKINCIFNYINELVINSTNKVYQIVNIEMFNLYCNVGKSIMRIQQGDEIANYGDAVLEKLFQN